MLTTTVVEKIESLLEGPLESEGYALVRIHVSGTVRKTLQLMIERLDGTDLTVKDCADVSRHASVLLDTQDPLPSAYILEVSSPGLDRPLVKPKDFKRFQGHDIKLNLSVAWENRKRFIGRLTEATPEEIRLTTIIDGEEHSFSVPYHHIASAKLFIDFESILGKKGKTSGKSKN